MSDPAATPQYYFVRLIPPRADFPFTQTPDERTAMQAHAAYWREKMAQGKALIAGPVNDPAGAWGLGVLRCNSEEELLDFSENDPVILARIGMRYETMRMLSVMLPA